MRGTKALQSSTKLLCDGCVVVAEICGAINRANTVVVSSCRYVLVRFVFAQLQTYYCEIRSWILPLYHAVPVALRAA